MCAGRRASVCSVFGFVWHVICLGKCVVSCECNEKCLYRKRERRVRRDCVVYISCSV